jgi:DNA-binding NtrC family response regulator
MVAKKTVLIVDDDKFFREILSKEFVEAGFKVITAVDGEDGLEKFRESKPEIVISDKIMPKMGGTRFLSLAREMEFSKEVIFVTMSSMIKGTPHEHDKDVLGSRVHIPKSTNPIDVVIIIEQLLDRKARS